MELNGKTIVALGDSLMYGAHLERNEPWLALLGEAYQMQAYNHGVSSTSVASSDITKAPAMWKRLRDEITYDHVDYFVLEGGGNDRRHNVPLGENHDNLADFGDVQGEIPTFKGAINYIINTVKTRWPGCRMLLMTNVKRKMKANDLGLTDEAYVNAMVEMAKFRGIPYIDNYHDIGVDFRTPRLAGCVTDYDWAALPDNHISAEGYRWLMPLYARKLMEL